MVELMDMLERLLLELASIGLELNVSKFSKPKILTNACLEEKRFPEVAGDFMEIFHGEHRYKYLGKKLTGDVVLRTNQEFDHRLHAAWAKLHS
jgi:hypothetical protein